MKKLLATILTVVLIVSVCPAGLFTFTASAETDGYYSYEISNGTATITSVSQNISGNAVIPSTLGGYPVTSIKSKAFYNCTKLTSIAIPDCVTSIGDSAFYNCTKLTSIAIPDCVTSIGDSAFRWCYSLTDITIPNSITSIGEGAFAGCGSLKYKIYDNARYIGNSENPYLVCLEAKAQEITNCSINSKTRFIYNGAFDNCRELTSVTIPDSVTSILSWAFYNVSVETVYYGGTRQGWSSLSNKPQSGNVIYYNEGIAITPPSKAVYTEGENLNLAGGTVSLIYSNSSELYKTVALKDSFVSGYNNRKLGKQNISVTYYGHTETFEITVVEKAENKTEFAGGKGFADSPFLISTKKQLNNVRKYPNAYFLQINDIEFSDSDFMQGGAYYENGYGWSPIGKDSSSAFTGSYNGGGHTIKNLKVNITTNNSAYGGLFGYCTGYLKNITVENSNITVTANGQGYAGGIVGYHGSGSIENCHNINTAVIAQYGGGIVGYSYYSSIVKNCSNSGKIDGIYIGGIVGTLYAPSVSGGTLGSYSDSEANIINCINSGNIIKNQTSGAYIGGIVGNAPQGTLIIRNCSNSGKIYAEGSDLSSILFGGGPIVGGIVGNAQNANIGNCSNSADLYGDFVGGILGYGNTKILNTTNTGNISGRNYVGGIIGYQNSGSVYTSVNKGSIVGIRYVNGKVYTYDSSCVAVGGIVGAAVNGSGIYECNNLGSVSNGQKSGGIIGIGDTVSRCYNSGKVSSAYYSGGICAELLKSSSSIANCYNTGNISGEYAAGILANMSQGTIQSTYNIGEIITNKTNGFVAAIVAYQTGGNISNCYYLDNMGVGVGYIDYSLNDASMTVKLQKSQMLNQDSFGGFLFGSTWTMSGNIDYPYPELSSVEMIYVPYTPGDINGDGSVNNKDLTRLFQYLSDWDVEVNEAALDVNGDGAVNNKDLTRLFQYLSDWDVIIY